MEHKYIAIVMEKKDIGETDRLYVFYTLEAGKTRALAKGVRKSGAKLAGALENFNLVNVFVAKNHGLGKITSVIVENNFPALHQNFDILQGIFSNFKLIEKLTDWDYKEQSLFQLIIEYLQVLEQEANSKKKDQIKILNLGFLFKGLALLGYQLEVGKCVCCQKKLIPGAHVFNARQGGIVCEYCFLTMDQNIFVSENCVKIMRIFFQNSLSSLLKIKVNEKDICQLNVIAREFARWIDS